MFESRMADAARFSFDSSFLRTGAARRTYGGDPGGATRFQEKVEYIAAPAA
jgi:hypothetical protein